MTSRDDAVEAVRSRTDIVALIGRYLKLKKVGSRYVGLCPFHGEKTPSFSVNPQKGFFHCFGCKASGDVFSFVMRMDGKTFPEALESLALTAGVELPDRQRVDPKKREHKQRLLDLLEVAAKFYEERLWHPQAGQAARDYLAQRGISSDLARRYRLGLAPPGWQNLCDHLRVQKREEGDSLEIGLAVKGNRGPYDLFRNRLIFSIVGLDGKVRGFGGRKLDPEEPGGKYINSSQGPVYDKSEILFGLDQARMEIQQTGRAVLVEGYIDVLSTVGTGLQGVVATSGTALTEGHGKLLRRFTDRVVTLFDGDEAGRKASFRSAELLLSMDISPYTVLLPVGQDPDDFAKQHGGQALIELIDGAKSSIEVLGDGLLAQAGDNVEARTRAVHSLLPLLKACHDPIRLSGYVRWCAERFGVDEAALRQGMRGGRAPAPARVEAPVRLDRSEARDWTDDELHCVTLLIQFAKLIKQAADSGVVGSFRETGLKSLIEALVQEGAATPSSLVAGWGDGAIKEALSARLVLDADLPAERAADDLEGCIRKIKARRLQERKKGLQDKITQAVRTGQDEERRRLLVVKMDVARELEALGVTVKAQV